MTDKKLIPLARPYIGPEELEAVRRVMEGRHLAQGPEALQLETDVAAILGTNSRVVAVSSGGAALYLALAAIGIKSGDEVVVPAFVFPAAAQASFWLGARAIAADVDPETMAIVPKTVEAVLSNQTRAIVVVHPFGIPARVEEIQDLVVSRNIAVIEDAACALGGLTAGGSKAGTVGDIGCYSLHPRKSATSGEGGLIVAPKAMAKRLAEMKDYGRTGSGDGDVFGELGLNFRMSDVAAAIARVQITRLAQSRLVRGKLVDGYREGITKITGVSIPKGYDLAGNTFQSMIVVTEKNTAEIRRKMAQKGVQAGVAAHNLTEQTFYRARVHDGVPCPVSEGLTTRTIALPLFDEMTMKQVEIVVSALASAMA